MAVSIIIILSLFLGILTVGIADLLERQTQKHKHIVKAIYTQNAANPIHVSFAHESKV